MPNPLKVEREPLDRWIKIRAISAQRHMPLFDDLPEQVRRALYNMKSGPKWNFIKSLSKSVTRGTTVKFLLRKIEKEDERRLGLMREVEREKC